MKLKVPYLKWRDGRPRWEPGPRLRKAGWKGRDLRDEAGQFLDLQRAIQAASRLNDELREWRANGEPRKRMAAPKKASRTAQHLWETYIESPRFQAKAASTRRDYRNKAAIFLAEFGAHPVAAIDKAHLYRWWEELYAARGHAMANGVLAVVRAMMSHAARIGWRSDNPAAGLGLPGVAPRQVLWLPEEVEAIVAAADRLGMPSVGDAVIAALHSGQRQGDVLAMPLRIFDDQRIRLSQLKMRSRGGALIDAPMTPALTARVAAIRKRRAGLSNVVDLGQPLVLREDTGERYDSHAFGKAFRLVRRAAVADCPALAERTFQDLRDTAVTRLALAGCELPQIAAITGHSLVSITSIIRHYLVLQPAMADAAIAKLSAWLDTQGIAL